MSRAHRSHPSPTLYVVGARSAECARKLGFTATIYHAPTVEALLTVIESQDKPSRLLYIRGADVALRLDHRLKASGIEVAEMIAYKAEPVLRLTEETGAALKEGVIDAVLLMSARTAQAFLSVAITSGLVDTFKRVSALCLSQQVADQVPRDIFKRIVTAAQPDEEALLALLEETDSIYGRERAQ